MKKRHLKALAVEDRVAIAKEYLEDKRPMADVAAKYHVSSGLAGRICRDYKSGGSKLGR